jgi:hypothetical protein
MDTHPEFVKHAIDLFKLSVPLIRLSVTRPTHPQPPPAVHRSPSSLDFLETSHQHRREELRRGQRSSG